jgi:3D (Asp-Asp-Asp) domain-containing protein
LSVLADACLLPGPQGGSSQLKLRWALVLALGTVLSTAVPVLAQGTAGNRYVVVGTGGDGLMIRDGPGTDAAGLGSLPDGTEVLALDSAGGVGQSTWLRVQRRGGDGLVGWCSANYLRALASASTQTVSATAAAPPPPPPSAAAARTIAGVVTGYATGDDGGRVGATTASGTRAHWGTLAADVKLYPFGTKLAIEGFEGTVFVVEDTGGAMHGDIFDVWFPDMATAAAFGTQHRKVTILAPT